jgi:hypothetical protein
MRKIKSGKDRSNLFILLYLSVILTVFIFGIFACSPGDNKPENKAEEIPVNTLTSDETASGWILLFDGKSFKGWRGLGRDSMPEGHWTIEKGAMKKISSGEVPLQLDGQPQTGGDILTENTYTDFELHFEWKISPGGNSGIKYNVSEDMSTSFPPRSAALGFEYQILDDDGHPDAQNGENRTAAALYDLMAPQDKILKPPGEWNTARIVFIGNHGEHWLNGIKVLEYNLGTPEMEKRLGTSKYRVYDHFGEKRRGHIVIQDHTDEAWYRNIKMKEF